MWSRAQGGSRVTCWLLITFGFMAAGCSDQMDPGLDMGPGGVLKAPAPAPTFGEADAPVRPEVAAVKPAEPNKPLTPMAPIRPEEIEAQLRRALRAIERNELDRATQILDAILAAEPVHREALAGRAKAAFIQFRTTKDQAEREAAISKAAQLVRAVRRAYEKSNKAEQELLGRVLFNEAKFEAERGKLDRAAAILKESYDAGLDSFFRVETEPTLATLKESKVYKETVAAVDAAALARAKLRIQHFLDDPLPLKFDFTLPNLDGKPVSLSDFKGKVVIVDFWGTWCEPCVKLLPGLIDLHTKNARRGFSVVGLAYEQAPPEYAKQAVERLKAFVTGSSIPYPILIGDDATTRKIPGFNSFPTTLVIDRAGRLRLAVLENQENTIEVLTDVIQVLLAEPAPKPGDPPALIPLPAPPATMPWVTTPPPAKPVKPAKKPVAAPAAAPVAPSSSPAPAPAKPK